jgi:flavin-dependent dehydrogenase
MAAVRSGHLAGQVAAEALADGRPTTAGDTYEARWRKQHGHHAARQLDKRNEMEVLWNRDPVRAVKRAWLGH